jgi:hypothetical protein
VLPGFGASQFFPPAFALAFAFHPGLALLFGVATLLSTQRGQVLGLLIALVSVSAPGVGRIPEALRAAWMRPRRVLVMAAIMIPLIALAVLVATKSSESFTLLLSKYASFFSGKDESSAIRAGHIAGYLQTAHDTPMELIWGVGPGSSFYNAVSGDQIFMTEMVILIYAFWYGWLYTIVFYAWIAMNLYSLAHRSTGRFDATLVAAGVVLIIVGNLNPVMLTPLAFFFLALLRARRLELAPIPRVT